jgi:HrpA-like RNA helicase
MTIPQLCLLLLINYHNSISAKELGKKLGITNKQLGALINSFLSLNIITRSQTGSNNDVNMTLNINNNFSYNNSHISLVNAYKQFMTNNHKFGSQEQNNIITDNVLQTEVLGLIIKNNTLTLSELVQKLKQKFNKEKEIESNRIIKVLEEYISSGHIIKNQDVYSYNIKTISQEIGDDLDAI